MVTVVAETAEGPGSNPGSVTCLYQVCYRINFLFSYVDVEGLPVSSLNCDRQ